MTDIRARLEHALWVRLPKSEVLGPIYVKEMADVLADAALSLPDIAIVDIEDFRRRLRSHSYDLGWGKLIKIDNVDALLTESIKSAS